MLIVGNTPESSGDSRQALSLSANADGRGVMILITYDLETDRLQILLLNGPDFRSPSDLVSSKASTSGQAAPALSVGRGRGILEGAHPRTDRYPRILARPNFTHDLRSSAP